MLGIQTQILIRVWQGLSPLSYLPSPQEDEIKSLQYAKEIILPPSCAPAPLLLKNKSQLCIPYLAEAPLSCSLRDSPTLHSVSDFFTAHRPHVNTMWEQIMTFLETSWGYHKSEEHAHSSLFCFVFTGGQTSHCTSLLVLTCTRLAGLLSPKVMQGTPPRPSQPAVQEEHVCMPTDLLSLPCTST